MQLIINQNWFRQWLGTEKTLGHYLGQWWSRPMVHRWVSRIDWVDYFTVLGKYIHAEKNGTVWAHEGYLHPHNWKWPIPTPQVGSGRGTGWPYFVKSPIASTGVNSVDWHAIFVGFSEWISSTKESIYGPLLVNIVKIKDYFFLQNMICSRKLFPVVCQVCYRSQSEIKFRFNFIHTWI